MKKLSKRKEDALAKQVMAKVEASIGKPQDQWDGGDYLRAIEIMEREHGFDMSRSRALFPN